MHPMPENHWEIIVASAAPSTPHRNTITNTRSSTMFITAAIPRKISGVMEFPTALSSDAKKLYRNVAMMPANITSR